MPVFPFYLFIYFLRQRETEREQGKGRGRHRIWSRLQALSCQHRAQCGAWTHRLWDRDLSRSRTLNRRSHPGTPCFTIFIFFFLFNFSKWELSQLAFLLPHGLLSQESWTEKRPSRKGLHSPLSVPTTFYNHIRTSYISISDSSNSPWTLSSVSFALWHTFEFLITQKSSLLSVSRVELATLQFPRDKPIGKHHTGLADGWTNFSKHNWTPVTNLGLTGVQKAKQMKRQSSERKRKGNFLCLYFKISKEMHLPHIRQKVNTANTWRVLTNLSLQK